MTAFLNEHRATVKKSLEDFSKSMWVKMMDTQKKGGAAAPTFNVHTKGKLINNNGLWCSLQNFLASQSYALQFQDPGPTGTDLHRCSICHSIEHPRGLCPFPKIKGWNGPFWEIPDTDHADDNRRCRQMIVKKGKGPNYK
jgi:hypothetical protein